MNTTLPPLLLDWLAHGPLLGLSIGVAGGGLLMTIVNVISAPRLERRGPRKDPESSPRVSLLIPFRDELPNLQQTLPLLSDLRYPHLEILLLNDFSNDGGEKIARSWAEENPRRFRVIEGAPLPTGWLGKNWACAQLSAQATGEILIFCDADVRIGAEAVDETVTAFQRLRCDLLTAMPFQSMGHLSERAIIPLVMHLSIFSLLPLKWLPTLRSRSATFANGQWLAFTRAAYSKLGGHASVKDQALEDVALARRAGLMRLTLTPVLAVRSLHVRMYRGTWELLHGFSKNLAPLAGGHPLTVLGVTAWMIVAWLLPLATPAGFLILLGQRLLLSHTFRYPWGTSLLHPFGAVGAICLLWYSAGLRWLNLRVLWKSRPV